MSYPLTHPDRIRFGEVIDILGKVNTRKACGPDHINKLIRYLIPTLHIILQDLLNICVFHGLGLEQSIVPDGSQTIQNDIRPMLLQAHFPFFSFFFFKDFLFLKLACARHRKGIHPPPGTLRNNYNIYCKKIKKC